MDGKKGILDPVTGYHPVTCYQEALPSGKNEPFLRGSNGRLSHTGIGFGVNELHVTVYRLKGSLDPF